MAQDLKDTLYDLVCDTCGRLRSEKSRGRRVTWFGFPHR